MAVIGMPGPLMATGPTKTSEGVGLRSLTMLESLRWPLDGY
jgi:hypothetical protein